MAGKELEQARDSMVQVKVGNRTYPAVQSSRCGVCMHPGRVEIEERLLSNYGYPAIVNFVADKRVTRNNGTVEDWPPLSKEQIRSHYTKGHCPLDTELLRQLSEERAKELGAQYEDSVGRLVDHQVFQRAVIARGYDRLVRGEINPDVKDTLAASKMLADLEANAQAVASQDQWAIAMQVYFEVVQESVTAEQWAQIGKRLNANPVLRALSENSVVDAETVDE